MKPSEQIQDEPVEYPVSYKGRSKFGQWMKRIGVIGIIFFLVKGLLWLAVFIFGVEVFKNMF